ncbi:MAG: hypothetical protein ACRDP5_24090 [Streptosporangiaceae bacterium]
MPKISTPFAGVPDEVTDQEYAALQRQGLLASGPAAAEPEPEPVEVRTTFGRTVTVSPDEAAALRRQGLAVETTAGRLPVPAAAQTPPAAETTAPKETG